MLQRRWRPAMLLYLLLRTSSSNAQEPWEVSVDNTAASSAEHHGRSTVLDALRKLQETLSSSSSLYSHQSLSAQKSKQKRKRRATRRRALMEHTLQSHYHQDSFSHHLHSALSDDSSWGHAPCVFYNELKSSYWTYQWCASQGVAQAHWIPTASGEFKADFFYKLGSYTPEPWTHQYGAEGADVEYFDEGDECVIENSDGTTTTVKRRTVVLKNPEPQCGANPFHEWRIVAVTEPSPCTYIMYACGPSRAHHHKTSTTSRTKKPPSTAASADLPVLRAYLHEADVGEAAAAADRTTSWRTALPPLPSSRITQNRQLITEMFQHAYDSYMYHAFPASEIQPLTCTPGIFSLVKLPALTLVDSLDTLLVMGNTTEFARSVERLRSFPNMFAVNQNVSVFETNIRVLGGLLSAHQMALAYIANTDIPATHVWDEDGNVKYGGITLTPPNEEQEGTCNASNEEESSTHVSSSSSRDGSQQQQQPMCTATGSDQHIAEQLLSTLHVGEPVCMIADTKQNATDENTCSLDYWTYDGLLLEMAHDLGTRLLPAFDTKTGIPYGTINLLHGIPHGETTVASLAGGGTLSLEMELLSRLTGDESFGKAAKLAARALWIRRSPKQQLLGKHIEIIKGDWTESLSGIGSNSDSFYEYLIKHYALFPEDADFWTMFVAAYNGVYNGTRMGEWYADADMSVGARNGGSRRVFESLQAFYPGMQALVGELGPAARSLNSFFLVREFLGFLPERFNYGNWKVDGQGGAAIHPLRPELLESCYFLHQATKTGGNGTQSSGWLWAADFALHTLNELTDTTCGFATVKDLSPLTTGTIPPEDSQGVRLANEMPSFFLSETLKYLYLTFDDDNLLHQDDEREWIFTTEAHPIHFVPKKKAQSKEAKTTCTDQLLDDRKQRVKKLLERRLTKPHRTTHNIQERQSVSSGSKSTGLVFEKWSGNTHLSSYIHGLRESDAETMARKQDPPLFRPFLVPEDTQEINLAYLTFGDLGMGDGSSLRKSCPNFHRSSIQWIRALNGGVLGYSDVYVSSMSDDLYSEAKPEALSASEALSYHGSGLFLGKFSDPQGCSVSGDQSIYAETAVSPDKTPPNADDNPIVQRFDLGGDHGEFEISALSEGFMIKQIQTGELVLTTVLVDEIISEQEEEEGESTKFDMFLMVYYIKPLRNSVSSNEALSKKWKLGTNWRSIFSRKAQRPSPEPVERSVVFADVNSRAFRCEVQLMYSIDGTEHPLAVYPCAPALFGPTRLSHLVQLGELEVGGDIHLPDPFDEHGCSEGDSRLPTTIQIVRRGVCTFQRKSLNQKARSGAEAVIIVNSVADELFLMADDGIDNDTPVTVLVTKHDGEDMMAAMKEGGATTARVRLIPHEEEGNIKGEGTSPVDWPIIRTSPEPVVQILSESGWGIHAVNQPSVKQEGARDWQLFLIRHNNGNY